MNIPLNFCAKCGNPKNPGERVCRFCGEPFPEASAKDIFQDEPSEETAVDAASADAVAVQPGQTAEDKPTDGVISLGENQPAGSESEVTIPAQTAPHVNEETAEQTMVPQADAPQPGSPAQATVAKKSRKGLWIALIAVLVVALAVGVVLFVNAHRNSPSATVTTALEAIQHNDSEAFCETLNLSNETRHYIKDMSRKVMSVMGNDFKGFEILDEKVDGQKATVKVRMTHDNGKTDTMDLHLVKIDDAWKIEPLGDFGFGLDSLFELGKQFGIGGGSSLQDDLEELLNGLF